MAFAKVLETLGVNWAKILTVPKFDTTQFSEVRELMDKGIHREQYTFRLDGSLIGEIFKGSSPNNDGTELVTLNELKESYQVPL